MKEINVLKLNKTIPAKAVEESIEKFIDNETTHILLNNVTYKRLLNLVQEEKQMFYWHNRKKIPFINDKMYRMLLSTNPQPLNHMFINHIDVKLETPTEVELKEEIREPLLKMAINLDNMEQNSGKEKELPLLPEILDVDKMNERIKSLEEANLQSRGNINVKDRMIKSRDTSLVKLEKKIKQF